MKGRRGRHIYKPGIPLASPSSSMRPRCYSFATRTRTHSLSTRHTFTQPSLHAFSGERPQVTHRTMPVSAQCLSCARAASAQVQLRPRVRSLQGVAPSRARAPSIACSQRRARYSDSGRAEAAQGSSNDEGARAMQVSESWLRASISHGPGRPNLRERDSQHLKAEAESGPPTERTLPRAEDLADQVEMETALGMSEDWLTASVLPVEAVEPTEDAESARSAGAQAEVQAGIDGDGQDWLSQLTDGKASNQPTSGLKFHALFESAGADSLRSTSSREGAGDSPSTGVWRASASMGRARGQGDRRSFATSALASSSGSRGSSSRLYHSSQSAHMRSSSWTSASAGQPRNASTAAKRHDEPENSSHPSPSARAGPSSFRRVRASATTTHGRTRSPNSRSTPEDLSFPRHILNPSPYDIFRLPRTSSASQIKSRYYDLVRVLHPDKLSSASASSPSETSDADHLTRAQEEFKSVVQAYELLRDPHRREMYNRLGVGWGSSNSAMFNNSRAPPGFGARAPSTPAEWAAYAAWSDALRRGGSAGGSSNPNTRSGWEFRGDAAHDRYGWQRYAGSSDGDSRFYGFYSAHAPPGSAASPRYTSNGAFFGAVAVITWVVAAVQYQRLVAQSARAVAQADKLHLNAARSLAEARGLARSDEGKKRKEARRRRAREMTVLGEIEKLERGERTEACGVVTGERERASGSDERGNLRSRRDYGIGHGGPSGKEAALAREELARQRAERRMN